MLQHWLLEGSPWLGQKISLSEGHLQGLLKHDGLMQRQQKWLMTYFQIPTSRSRNQIHSPTEITLAFMLSDVKKLVPCLEWLNILCTSHCDWNRGHHGYTFSHDPGNEFQHLDQCEDGYPYSYFLVYSGQYYLFAKSHMLLRVINNFLYDSPL